MSKRHQSNRRKSYSRRQHELHERAAARITTRPTSRTGLDDVGATGIVDRLAFLDPRTPRLRFATGRLTMAVYQGARQRATIVLPRAPGLGAGPAAPPKPGPRRCRVVARGRPCAPAAAPRGSRSCSARSWWCSPPRSSRCQPGHPRVRHRATSWTGSPPSTGCSTSRADDLHNELNRLGKSPAVRKQAIDAGLGPLPEPIVIPAR